MSPMIQHKEVLQINQWENFFISTLYFELLLYSLAISIKAHHHFALVSLISKQITAWDKTGGTNIASRHPLPHLSCYRK